MLQSLFSGADFMPRIRCGLWTPGLLWLTVIAELGIFLAYMLISGQMCRLIMRRGKELPFKPLWWFYTIFIYMCGNTHIVSGVLMFWYPAYRLSTLLVTGTALISLPAAIIVSMSMPILLMMRTPAQVAEDILQARMAEQQEALVQLGDAIDRLMEVQKTTVITDRDEVLKIFEVVTNGNPGGGSESGSERGAKEGAGGVGGSASGSEAASG